MITQEYLKTLLDYNENTGDFYWKKLSKTSNRKIGQIAGSNHNRGYRHIRIDNKLYLSHRLAWLYVYGYFPKQIDHIDGDKHNNKISNLREVTTEQNMWNSLKRKDNTSGVRGVHFDKNINKWKVRIQVNNKRMIIGSFDDLELAELVAIESRIKYYGTYTKEAV